MVEIYAINNKFLYLKSSLAKAYAAKLLVRSWRNVTMIVNFVVLSTNLDNGIFVQIST